MRAEQHAEPLAPDDDDAADHLAAVARLATRAAVVAARGDLAGGAELHRMLCTRVDGAGRALGLDADSDPTGPVDGTPPGWRPWTPDRKVGNRTQVTVKRCCNGCATTLGDVRGEETLASVQGGALPDVRDECVTCLRRRIATLEAMRQPVSQPDGDATGREPTQADALRAAAHFAELVGDTAEISLRVHPSALLVEVSGQLYGGSDANQLATMRSLAAWLGLSPTARHDTDTMVTVDLRTTVDGVPVVVWALFETPAVMAEARAWIAEAAALAEAAR